MTIILLISLIVVSYKNYLLKNLKGSNIAIANDYPKEIENIHKTLYPVLKKAKQEKNAAFFKVDRLIINGQIYKGNETINLPFYGSIM